MYNKFLQLNQVSIYHDERNQASHLCIQYVSIRHDSLMVGQSRIKWTEAITALHTYSLEICKNIIQDTYRLFMQTPTDDPEPYSCHVWKRDIKAIKKPIKVKE